MSEDRLTAALVKRAAEYIYENDPFGDHFSEHDVEQLRALAKSLADQSERPPTL